MTADKAKRYILQVLFCRHHAGSIPAMAAVIFTHLTLPESRSVEAASPGASSGSPSTKRTGRRICRSEQVGHGNILSGADARCGASLCVGSVYP